MKSIELIYFLNILITLFAIGIVSLMVKNEVRLYKRVRFFVWLYAMVCFGCVALFWYAMIYGIVNGEINWFYQ